LSSTACKPSSLPLATLQLPLDFPLREHRAGAALVNIAPAVLTLAALNSPARRGAGLSSGSEKKHYRYLGRLPISA
jgi:hypothetical protein